MAQNYSARRIVVAVSDGGIIFFCRRFFFLSPPVEFSCLGRVFRKSLIRPSRRDAVAYRSSHLLVLAAPALCGSLCSGIEHTLSSGFYFTFYPPFAFRKEHGKAGRCSLVIEVVSGRSRKKLSGKRDAFF